MAIRLEFSTALLATIGGGTSRGVRPVVKMEGLSALASSDSMKEDKVVKRFSRMEDGIVR